MTPTLTIEINDTAPDYELVKFVGDFDKAGHMDIHSQVDELVNKFVKTSLVFDFTDLQFINSEGIGYLMEIHAHLVKTGKKLVIVGANARIEDVFQAIGLMEIVPTFKDLKSFLAK